MRADMYFNEVNLLVHGSRKFLYFESPTDEIDMALA
jgi:hypothetical protein